MVGAARRHKGRAVHGHDDLKTHDVVIEVDRPGQIGDLEMHMSDLVAAGIEVSLFCLRRVSLHFRR